MSEKIVAAVKKIAEADPTDAAVEALIQELEAEVDLLSGQAKESEDGFGKDSMEDDVAFIKENVDCLRKAAEVPARNYARIASVLAALGQAVEVSRRPQNASARPALSKVVKKVAALMQEADVGRDLSEPLGEIETAVRALYG